MKITKKQQIWPKIQQIITFFTFFILFSLFHTNLFAIWHKNTIFPTNFQKNHKISHYQITKYTKIVLFITQISIFTINLRWNMCKLVKKCGVAARPIFIAFSNPSHQHIMQTLCHFHLHFSQNHNLFLNLSLWNSEKLQKEIEKINRLPQ